MTEESSTPTIVQQFLIMIEDEGNNDVAEETLPVDFIGDVVGPLKMVGYRVLASMEVTNGIPHNILVEGPMYLNGMDLKERFYTLLRCAGLRAMSGDALLEL